jgi:hypothetical protein
MNKVYILVFALLLSATVFAERPRSGRLTIATYDNASIRVEIDGRRYSERDNTIRINNINPGHHSIQVYRMTSGDIFSRSRERLIYSTSLYVKPEYQVDIYIDRAGRADVRERDLGKKGRNNRNDDWDRDNSRWDDYERWENNNGNNGNNGKWDDRKDDRYDRNDDRYDRNDYGRAVSYESFQSMKQSLRRESFDNTRLTLAKQMMERNNFEAAQVKEMLQFFSFESNRLELAKYAYRNTVDKKNYYVVYDMFSFTSSKEELSRYIGNDR